jgi:predicted  nucleic acid-binding Zn-ribbon protein
MIRGELLYELQGLDQEIEDIQHRLSEIQSSLGETDALRQARQALETAQKEHRDWVTKARHLELEIQTLSTKMSASEKRLYSGSVKNPKELSDMQEEIASLSRRRGVLEDELLEAMVYTDDAEATLTLCQKTLDNTESQWQSTQAALNTEMYELQARLATAQAERAQSRQTIAVEDLAFYDKVRSRYGSITVTTLRDGVCGYCAVAPSSTKLGRLRSGRELLQCGNCGRILLDL